eukprot:1159346-Pelagomonas_calceolata.AAC.2
MQDPQALADKVKQFEGKLAALQAINQGLQKENDKLRRELARIDAPPTDAEEELEELKEEFQARLGAQDRLIASLQRYAWSANSGCPIWSCVFACRMRRLSSRHLLQSSSEAAQLPMLKSQSCSRQLIASSECAGSSGTFSRAVMLGSASKARVMERVQQAIDGLWWM